MIPLQYVCVLSMEFSWEFLLRYPCLFDKKVPSLSTWTSSLSPHCPLAQASNSPSVYSPRLPVTSLYAPPPSPTGRLPVLLPQLGFLFLPTLPLTWASTLPYPWASSPSTSAPLSQAFSSIPTLPLSLSPRFLFSSHSSLRLLVPSSFAPSPPSEHANPQHPHLGFKWIEFLYRWDSITFKNWS